MTAQLTPPRQDSDLVRAERLVERLFADCLGGLELLSMHLGARLGLYRALVDAGPATPATLADAAGIAERYAREWLEQQAAAGIVEVDDVEAGPRDRRYHLPAGHVEVLLDEQSLSYAQPFGAFVACAAKPLQQLVEAFRTGGGVHSSYYDPEHREAQAAFNRPAFHRLLADEWLARGAPDLHARLAAAPARVAEIGCGCGWAAIALARAYPGLQVDGFDIDAPSIADARRNAAAAGVSDRVRFQLLDAAAAEVEHAYDLVLMVEVLHDVARPVEVLRSARRMLAPGGRVLVVDERVGERFTGPADPVERFMYVCSVLHCLPAAMVEQPSAATGTVMRPDTVHGYAAAAGLTGFEVLPVDNDFFRFYCLTS